MVFYVEIVNIDTTSVEVNPASFYYTHTYTSSDTTYEKPQYRIPAKNPEDEIKRIDKMIRDEKDSYTAYAIINGVVALTDAVVGIISLFSGDDEEEEYEEEYCGGFVEFAVSRDLKMITIHIPVGESDICCRFSQKWVTL